MHTYKFLRRGAVSPITGFRWPRPDVWVDAGDVLEACRAGIHVCLIAHLPHWISEELWEVEIAGTRIDAPASIVASRARLVRRIEGWDAQGARSFAEACAERAAALAPSAPAELRAQVAGYASDARSYLNEALWCTSAYVAACTAIVAAPGRPPDDVLREERAWQAEMLAAQLGLED